MMPRFRPGEFLRFTQANQDAYEFGTAAPLDTYLLRAGSEIPLWAVREIERTRWNIAQLPPQLTSAPTPLPLLTLPAGATIVDALIRIGGEESVRLSTARVHIEGWMTDDDIIARVKQIVEQWSKDSGPAAWQADESMVIETFWRVR